MRNNDNEDKNNLVFKSVRNSEKKINSEFLLNLYSLYDNMISSMKRNVRLK